MWKPRAQKHSWPPVIFARVPALQLQMPSSCHGSRQIRITQPFEFLNPEKTPRVVLQPYLKPNRLPAHRKASQSLKFCAELVSSHVNPLHEKSSEFPSCPNFIVHAHFTIFHCFSHTTYGIILTRGNWLKILRVHQTSGSICSH